MVPHDTVIAPITEKNIIKVATIGPPRNIRINYILKERV
jgi:hypothetical protein